LFYHLQPTHLLSLIICLSRFFVKPSHHTNQDKVNQVTGGNYGLLNATPFIPDAPIWIKYLLVSIIPSSALVLFDILFKKRWQKKIALETIHL